MPVLNARLLGTPRFVVEGRELNLSAGKVRALYAYLVATRQLHSRDRLAAFFWPDVRERNALASLRTALYDLRRGLGDDAPALLRVERSRVGLPAELELDLDLAMLEGVGPEHGDVDSEALSAAVEAYGGPFLEGVSLPDAYDFDDWAFVERERLANLYLSALCRLGEQHASRGEHARAIDMARRVLAIDPLREEIHRALMRYLALDGQRAAALAQYQACAEQLEQELGIQPLGATTELYRQIASDAPMASEAKAPSAVSRAAADRSRRVLSARPELPLALRGYDGPVVGRDAELAALREAWRAAVDERGRLVLLSGEAGSGKTRLAALVAAEAGEEAVVLLGRCYESATHEPFGPVIGALRGALESIDPFALGVPEVWLRELARLLPELGRDLPGAPAPLDGVRDRDRLFEAVRSVMSAISERAPVLWIVDDVQWADETSMALLAYLSRSLGERRMLLLATCRDEDVSPSRRAQLRLLQAEGTRLRLGRLSSEDTAELIGSLAGEAELPLRLGRRLHERTGGNPFFLVETLRALFEQGSLRADDNGRWTTTAAAAQEGYDDLPVPESVGLIVDARLSRLSDDARAVADVAAVLRRDFDFALVQRGTSLGAAESLDGLDALLAMGVLREVPGEALSTRYDFNHALVRDRIYGRLSGARRQHMHRNLAGLLESLEPDAPDRVAYHYLRGGVRDRACLWSMRAGRAALEVHAAEDALAHFGTARQFSVGPAEEFGALSGLGDAHVALGAPEAAVKDYREALEVAADDVARAEILRRIGRAHDRRGGYDEALTAYEQARALLRGTPEMRSLTAIRLADGTATVYIRIGRVEQATALCRDALVLLEMSDLGVDDRRRSEAWVRNTLGMARLHAGDYAEAERHLSRSLELKRALVDQLGEATLLNNLGVVHYHCGDDMEALRHYARSLRIKRDIGDHYGSAIALTNLSLIETHLGRLKAAAEHLAEAESAAAEVGASWLMPEIRRVAAQRALALGEIEDGLDQAEQSLEAAEALGVPAFIGVAHRVLGLAKAHAANGASEGREVDAAEEHFRTSLAVFEMLADRHELAKTHAAFGEALLAEGRADEAADLLLQALSTFRDSGAHGRAERVAKLLGTEDGDAEGSEDDRR